MTPHPTPVLEIRGATVRKGRGTGRVILDSIELSIAAGENTAILGPNGSGKTSLIRLITQEYRALAGTNGEARVRIFGRDRWDVLELRRLLGIVTPDVDRMFADEDFVGNRRGIDVAVSGFFASPGVQPHQAIDEAMFRRACATLALMGAGELTEKRMNEMSTGEARRVLIARALVSDPPALLLDEPTAGLDMLATHRFLETLRGLAHRGKTLVLVTHHIHEIIPEVTRVVLLRDGRIFRDGPTGEVLTPATLSSAFGAPVSVTRTAAGYYSASVDEV